MDIANYSSDSRAIIKIAKEVAVEFRHPEIEVEHLLISVVPESLKKNPSPSSVGSHKHIKKSRTEYQFEFC